MPTKSELLSRIKKADALLAGDLPPGDRAKVSKLRLLDQVGVMIRQRRPDFDEKGPKDPKGPSEPPET